MIIKDSPSKPKVVGKVLWRHGFREDVVIDSVRYGPTIHDINIRFHTYSGHWYLYKQEIDTCDTRGTFKDLIRHTSRQFYEIFDGKLFPVNNIERIEIKEEDWINACKEVLWSRLWC